MLVPSISGEKDQNQAKETKKIELDGLEIQEELSKMAKREKYSLQDFTRPENSKRGKRTNSVEHKKAESTRMSSAYSLAGCDFKSK